MSPSQILTSVTLHSPSARQLSSILRQSLSERRHQLSSLDQVLLFTLAPSSTTSPEILSDIVSTLTRFYPVHVGCISAPLSYPYLGSRIRSEPNSCSLAYAFVNAVAFRSTISGQAEVQVGRWHAARQRMQGADARAIQSRSEDSQMRIFSEFYDSDGKVNWEDVWKLTGNSVSRQAGSEALPDALRNLDPLAVDSILYFSDRQPEGLATMLEGAFPQAIKLSLVASSTPFITGRPVTLFHNGSILSDGAVGVAFSSSSSSSHPPVVELSFPPLVVLSTNLTVTNSEGNLILSLDCQNPTKLLLSAIQRYDLASSHMTCVGKEDEFYVGVIDSANDQVSQLHRINAGDPSRGTIALDTASSLKEGSIVRLYRLRREPVPDSVTRIEGRFPNISLTVAPEMNLSNFKDKNAEGTATDSGCSVVSNAFLMASENGFTLSRGAQEAAWKCILPGAGAALSWVD